MAQVKYTDNLLKEYLIFRGFSNSLKTFEAEQKSEKDFCFRAEKIIERLNSYINICDLQSFRSLWAHLDNNLFTRLEHYHANTVKKLENGFLKLYLVTAHSNNRPDKVSEFFIKLSSELQLQPEWTDWFCFPFHRNPEELANFCLYFSKHWQDTLQISFKNFLSTIYQCLPQPTFTRSEEELALMKRLSEENMFLKSRIQLAQNTGLSLISESTPRFQSFTNTTENFKPSFTNNLPQNLNNINSFDVIPPGHIFDDFNIIASETLSTSQCADTQAKGIKSLIRNIGSNSSPIMGRKVALATKKRSGSVGRSWI